MADVENLNQFRKKRRRHEKEKRAADRRVQVQAYALSPKRKRRRKRRPIVFSNWMARSGKRPRISDCSFRSWLQPHDLPRVHKVQGIDRLFQTAHYVYRRLAVFLD